MNYLWDEQLHLFRRFTAQEFSYSDGKEVEQRLLSIVSSAADRGTFSAELLQAITDWPTEYHLSRARHCLVRPLEIRSGDRVLEMGCGCGAITRYLGEIGATVVAVEGSLDRARVAAERCRDLPNVRLFVDDLLRFETDQSFDFVLLIGVLEYAPLFSEQEDPVGHYLRSVSRFLAPGGKLVIAIENKLGLKYFNGCGEDHLGIPFFGIQNLYGPKTVRTFGRKELVAQISAAGLPHTYFRYPFPDYKLPTVILSEDGLSNVGFKAIDLLARSHGRDYTGAPCRSFDDALAFSALAENGLLADLSNSFLVVATAEPPAEERSIELASAYSIYRAQEYCTRTSFLSRGGRIVVSRESITTDASRPIRFPNGMTVTHHLGESDYQPGHQVFWRLLRARARSGDLPPIIEALRPWMEFLLQRARVPASEASEVLDKASRLVSYQLPGKYLDCTPFNVLDHDGQLVASDLEWQSDREVALGWVATRGILWSTDSGLLSSGSVYTVADLVRSLSESCRLEVTEAEIQTWLDQERVYQTLALDRPSEMLAATRVMAGIRTCGSELASLTAEKSALSQELALREKEVAQARELVSIQEGQLTSMNQLVKMRDDQIESLNRKITARDEQILDRQASLNRALAEAARARLQASARTGKLSSLFGSRMWRINAPFRTIGKLKPNYYLNQRQVKRDVQLIIQSGLFDAEWYLSRNQDVAMSRQDPLVHYLRLGGREGRSPSQSFDSKWYLEQNADVREQGVNPLVHYLRFGMAEGRQPIPTSVSDLLEAQADWDKLGRNRLRQFLQNNTRMAFPAVETPILSIILVFYNKAHLSFLCLRSIIENADVPYEVVIVNNRSEDETDQLLALVDGATVLNNSTNSGFGDACVRGSEQACGKYLCFLNNDTLLQAGSLSIAVENFGSDSRVGAVGGKILLADGKLQEAGSILWSDGSALGYGRGEDPNLPQYEFRRPVDYCSGAFLFTPRAIFLELGGFNDVYGPAYYEDADYCMQVWKAGFQVIYEPRAVIRHYESASSGGNEAARPAMAANQQIFRQRWSEQLHRHLPPSTGNILSARLAPSAKGLKILYIDDRVPHQYLGTGFPRGVEILRALAGHGHHVTCFTFMFPLREHEYSDIPRDIELLDGATQRERLLREYVPHSDVIWVSRPHNMKTLLQNWGGTSLKGKAPLIYDAEAIFAERDWLHSKILGRQLSPDALPAALHEEANLAKAADAVVVVTQRDRATMERAGVDRVYVVGYRLEVNPTPAGFAERHSFLFVGAMHGGDNPNADSMRYFCTAIWPTLHRTTNSELVIAGYGTDAALADLIIPGVRVVGPQEDLRALYNQARVFVVPTRYAAGMPLKALEAAAFGVPLVVSRLIGEQLGWQDGTDCLIADEAAAFAESCRRAFEEPGLWEQLRSNGLARVKVDLNDERFDETICEAVAAVSAGHVQQ